MKREKTLGVSCSYLANTSFITIVFDDGARYMKLARFAGYHCSETRLVRQTGDQYRSHELFISGDRLSQQELQLFSFLWMLDLCAPSYFITNASTVLRFNFDWKSDLWNLIVKKYVYLPTLTDCVSVTLAQCRQTCIQLVGRCFKQLYTCRTQDQTIVMH